MDPCFWRTAGTLGRLYKRASPALPVAARARFAELLRECRVHILPAASPCTRQSLAGSRPVVQDAVQLLTQLASRAERIVAAAPVQLVLFDLLDCQAACSPADCQSTSPVASPRCEMALPASEDPASGFLWNVEAKVFVQGMGPPGPEELRAPSLEVDAVGSLLDVAEFSLPPSERAEDPEPASASCLAESLDGAVPHPAEEVLCGGLWPLSLLRGLLADARLRWQVDNERLVLDRDGLVEVHAQVLDALAVEDEDLFELSDETVLKEALAMWPELAVC